jgi:OPT oligopeptide transporter protein
VFTVPIGVIQAITTFQVGIDAITDVVIGFALPDRPTVMLAFKSWGYITMYQALSFTSDLKLGHYMKIPHRPMFFCQIVATVVLSTVQFGVQPWLEVHRSSESDMDYMVCNLSYDTMSVGNGYIIVSH